MRVGVGGGVAAARGGLAAAVFLPRRGGGTGPGRLAGPGGRVADGLAVGHEPAAERRSRDDQHHQPRRLRSGAGAVCPPARPGVKGAAMTRKTTRTFLAASRFGLVLLLLLASPSLGEA